VGKISSGRADGELGEMNSIENKLWRDVQIASDGHEDKKKGTTHMDRCAHAGAIERRRENERR
jgi:hypothetical protein